MTDEDYSEITVENTSLNVVCDTTVTTGSTVNVTGSLLVDDEEGTPVAGANIYLQLDDTVYMTTTDDDGSYSQDITIPDEPAVYDLIVYFMGDSFYNSMETVVTLNVVYTTTEVETVSVTTSDASEEDTSNTIVVTVMSTDDEDEEDDESTATVTSITTDEEYTTAVTLLSSSSSSDDDTTEYNLTGTLVDGVATFDLPSSVEGIWEVTAYYPEQDVYKTSTLTEDVQFAGTPYFVTLDGATSYSSYVGHSITVTAVLYDNTGEILPYKEVVTKYGKSESTVTNSNSDYTLADGSISRTITDSGNDKNLVMLFHYGGTNSLNPCDLYVDLDFSKYKTSISASNVSITSGGSNTLTCTLYYYTDENTKKPFASRTVTFKSSTGTTLTATTNSSGQCSFKYTPTVTYSHTYTVTYAGASTYASCSASSTVTILSADSTGIDTMLIASLVDESKKSVQRNHPIEIKAQLVKVTDDSTNGDPVSGANVGAKITVTDSDSGAVKKGTVIPKTPTDEDGYVYGSFQYDGVGKADFTFNFAGNYTYNACDSVTLEGCSWTILEPELVASDICCSAGEKVDLKALLRYWRCDSDGYTYWSNINGVTVAFVDTSGNTIGSATTVKGVATLEGYSRSSANVGKIYAKFYGNSTYGACSTSFYVNTSADKTVQNTTLSYVVQDTGEYVGEDTDGSDYYYGVNELATIKCLLKDSDGDPIGNRIVTVTHNNSLDSTTSYEVYTDQNGVASLVYPGKLEYWTGTSTHTVTFNFSYAGDDECYTASNTLSVILHWRAITPTLSVSDVVGGSGMVHPLEAVLYYSYMGVITYVEGATITWKIGSTTVTGTTDEEGYASAEYVRTSLGTVVASATSTDATGCSSATTTYNLTTLSSYTQPTEFELDSEAVTSVEYRDLTDFDATLQYKVGRNAIKGRKVSVKVSPTGNGSYTTLLNEVYTDSKGMVNFRYADTSKVQSDTITIADTGSAQFKFGTEEGQYEDSTLTVPITWEMITPVIMCGDVSHVSGNTIYMKAYIYHRKYDNTLETFNNVDAILHISSSLEKSLTSKTGKLIDSDGYKRSSTGSATLRWIYNGQTDNFNAVTNYFTLTTYASAPTTTTPTLTPNYTSSDSLFVIRGEDSDPVSATLTDSNGNVLANKLVKTTMSKACNSSTSSTSASYDDTTTQYLVTDSNGVVTRYYHPSDQASTTDPKYYYMRFVYNEDGDELEYNSCTCYCHINATWIKPTLNCSYRIVTSDSNVDLNARLYYTEYNGTQVNLSGAVLQYVDSSGTTIGTATTDEDGLATLSYSMSSVGSKTITVQFNRTDQDSSSSIYNYASVTAQLVVKRVNVNT